MGWGLFLYARATRRKSRDEIKADEFYGQALGAVVVGGSLLYALAAVISGHGRAVIGFFPAMVNGLLGRGELPDAFFHILIGAGLLTPVVLLLVFTGSWKLIYYPLVWALKLASYPVVWIFQFLYFLVRLLAGLGRSGALCTDCGRKFVYWGRYAFHLREDHGHTAESTYDLCRDAFPHQGVSFKRIASEGE